MGKGDRKTKRGKIHLGTSGARRKKKKVVAGKAPAKKASKAKKTAKSK